jgi:hypothetical protein
LRPIAAVSLPKTCSAVFPAATLLGGLMSRHDHPHSFVENNAAAMRRRLHLKELKWQKYRHGLPQRHGGTFLMDGGQLTTLNFQEGIDLPHLASFVLLDSEQGRKRLTQYYEPYLAIAQRHRVSFSLSSPTWRSNPDWAEKLGYNAAG